MVEQVVIDVVANDKQLDTLLDKLVKSGQLSKQQADQFRRDSKTFEDAAKKRAKLLDEEIKDLTELKLRKQQAFSTAEIEKYNQRIRESERRIEALGGKVRRQQKSFIDFDSVARNLAGTLFAAFTVDRLIRFGVEAVKIAAKVEGIEIAFNKLNNASDLLEQIRTSTRGTVSDLELMRAAVRANNFQVPLEQLGTFFEFATNRAIETGESVDYLVDSIINGIGRKSTLVLDNLGISASELQQEIKKTGDFGEAAANIISRSLADSGEVADTTATKIAKVSAAFKNFQADVGEFLIETTIESEVESDVKKVEKAIDELGKQAQKTGDIDLTVLINKVKQVREESARTGAVARGASGQAAKAIFLQTDAVQSLLLQYERLKESQRDQRARESIENLTERIKEAASALRDQVSSSDMALAGFNQQSSGVKELLEDYDNYLIAIENGKTAIEALIEVRKKEYKEFERTQQALILERQERERVNDEIRTMVHLLGTAAVDSIIGEVEARKQRESDTSDIFEESLKRDEQQAEAFDSAEQSKLDKIKQFAKEDREIKEQQLEAEARIAQAQIELGRSVVSAFISVAKDSAGARSALLAFDKLAAVASIIINLQREIALNSSIIVPGIRDAANLQSRLRAAAGIATVVATTIPEFSGFAEGVIDLKGPGTSKSDSIPARLSKGESVMTAEVTRKHKPDLKAMHAKKWEDHVFQNYQLPAIKSFIAVNKNEFHDRNIVNGLYKLRKGQDRLIAEVRASKEHQLSMR